MNSDKLASRLLEGALTAAVQSNEPPFMTIPARWDRRPRRERRGHIWPRVRAASPSRAVPARAVGSRGIRRWTTCWRGWRLWVGEW
jgi:hypothetical protein